MLKSYFEAQNKRDDQLAADEAMVPEKLDAASFKTVERRITQIKENLKDRVYLNFARCRRINGSGLHALCDFAEQMHSDQKHVYLTDMNNDIFKALKLSGHQSKFRFPHHGEYRTEGFGQGNVRC